MKNILLITLFLSIGFSQTKVNVNNLVQYGDKYFKENDDRSFTGIVFDISKETGKKILEFRMVDGLKNGIYKEWYPDGTIKTKGKYSNDDKDGKWTEWNDNGGQKDREKTYKDGKEIEKTSWTYYENGQKKSEETWKDRKRDGLSTSWYENGQKKEEGTYKDWKQDGLWTHYTDVGNGKYEVTYKAGIYTVAVFTDNLGTNYKGSPIITDFIGQDGTYLSGNKIEDKYDFSKFPWQVATLKDGKLDGLKTEWYGNGQKKSEETWKDRRFIVNNGWDKNGNIMVNNGNGLWTEWNDNGQNLFMGIIK